MAVLGVPSPTHSITRNNNTSGRERTKQRAKRIKHKEYSQSCTVAELNSLGQVQNKDNIESILETVLYAVSVDCKVRWSATLLSFCGSALLFPHNVSVSVIMSF